MPAPTHIENILRWLLPPACREHVLGDLHEKCKSQKEYLVEAISILGPVIISRIRRTTDFQLFVMEVFALYLSFAAVAWFLGEKAFLYGYFGFARLAIPIIIAAIGLLICNAYADPQRELFIKPILQASGSISVAFLGQATLFDTGLTYIPLGIMVYGSLVGVMIVSTLRMLFSPLQLQPVHPRPLFDSRPYRVSRFKWKTVFGVMAVGTLALMLYFPRHPSRAMVVAVVFFVAYRMKAGE